VQMQGGNEVDYPAQAELLRAKVLIMAPLDRQESGIIFTSYKVFSLAVFKLVFRPVAPGMKGSTKSAGLLARGKVFRFTGSLFN